MSKAAKPAPIVQPQSNVISAQSAIYILNSKIQKLEEMVKSHMDVIERKFGDHETYVTDNIPDLDLINRALADINSRLLEAEAFEGRIAALESASNIKPAAAPKKRGTVKLADLAPTPVSPSAELGISFS
jgi:hypothetical protein